MSFKSEKPMSRSRLADSMTMAGLVLLGIVPAIFGSVRLRQIAGGIATADHARFLAMAGHGAWMMRAYALGMGAGTQVFTHIPLMMVPSLRSELSRAIAMGAAWGINALVAEYFIQRSVQPRAANQRYPALSLPAAVP